METVRWTVSADKSSRVYGALMLERGDLDLIQEEYVRKLIETLDKVERNVARTSPSSSQEPTHPFKVGDLVVVQQLNRTKKAGISFWTSNHRDRSNQDSHPCGRTTVLDTCQSSKEGQPGP